MAAAALQLPAFFPGGAGNGLQKPPLSRLPDRFGNREGHVFVADEFFHYSTFGGWTRYRFTSGARVALNARTALDLYCLT